MRIRSLTGRGVRRGSLSLLAASAAIGAWGAVGATDVPSAAAQDWPGWRGPRHDGSADGGGILQAEHIALELLWRRPLGSGYSGVAVAGGLAVTQFSADGADWLVALEATTGTERWRVRLDTAYAGHDGSDDGPSATPVIGGDSVYGLSAQGRLLAVGLADGALRWERRLDDGLDATPSSFGFATTPLVAGDLLVVATGGPAGAFTAFDRATGDIRWRSGTDTVEYQSPILATLQGRRIILAPGNDLLLGLDPHSGAEIWRLDYGPAPRYSTSAVVPVGEDRLLVNPWPDTALYRVARQEAAWRLDELWREQTLDARLSTSVAHDGHVYGFDGRFLTCVDAASGQKVWKSRPPGGGAGLILVDGHLMLLGADGDLVVARATPEGYRERARSPALNDPGATYPSFAGGVAFVRNTEEIAAVAVRARDTPASAAGAPQPLGRLGLLAERLRRSDSPHLVVDDFLRSLAALPVVDEGGLTHFLWRGAAEDVGIQGSHLGWGEEPLSRLADTDLWYRSERLPPGMRVEYRYNVDFDNVGPDAANPWRVPAEWGADYSVLALPGHPAPTWLRAYAGEGPGQVVRETTSAILGREREIVFWLPAGHRPDGSARLLVLVEGQEWLAKGLLLDALRQRVGVDVPATVVAFVGRPERGGSAELAGTDTLAFVDALAVGVPEWTQRFGLSSRPADRAIMGRWSGAHAALVAGLAHPEVFGRVAVTSLLAHDERAALLERVASAPAAGARFHVYWNLHERWDADTISAEVHAALRAAGHPVVGGQRVDSAGWGGWRAWAAETLGTLFEADGR